MTPKEFFDKVVEMRRCQKEYFKNKRQIDLRISKQIEREVDEEIERVTEAGWMKGAGKRVMVYSPEKQEPELMYKIYDFVSDNIFRINDKIIGV